MSIKISVIIPVYDVEEYLEACLDSLLSQTLKEIEIICINDESPDHSLAILERYAENDDRVKVFTQKNQGQGVARSNGFAKATGAYIYFMDSDDYLTVDTALETMYSACVQDDLDFLSFNFKRVGLVEEDHVRDIVTEVLMDGKSYMQEEGVFVMLWLRLYKKSFLDEMEVLFTPYIQHDDAEFFPRMCYRAKKVKHIEDILIAWRQRQDSRTRSPLNEAKVAGLITAVKRYLELSAIEPDPQISAFFHKRALIMLFETYSRILSSGYDKKVDYSALFASSGLSKLEIKLLENEEKYIKHVEIEGHKKLSNPWIYYLRRFRIIYFKHIKKYGSDDEK